MGRLDLRMLKEGEACLAPTKSGRATLQYYWPML